WGTGEKQERGAGLGIANAALLQPREEDPSVHEPVDDDDQAEVQGEADGQDVPPSHPPRGPHEKGQEGRQEETLELKGGCKVSTHRDLLGSAPATRRLLPACGPSSAPPCADAPERAQRPPRAA